MAKKALMRLSAATLPMNWSTTAVIAGLPPRRVYRLSSCIFLSLSAQAASDRPTATALPNHAARMENSLIGNLP